MADTGADILKKLEDLTKEVAALRNNLALMRQTAAAPALMIGGMLPGPIAPAAAGLLVPEETDEEVRQRQWAEGEPGKPAKEIPLDQRVLNAQQKDDARRARLGKPPRNRAFRFGGEESTIERDETDADEAPGLRRPGIDDQPPHAQPPAIEQDAPQATVINLLQSLVQMVGALEKQTAAQEAEQPAMQEIREMFAELKAKSNVAKYG